MYLLAKSRHYFVNGSLIVPENGLLNLASDLYDTVYVSMDFQAKDGSVFQMLVIDRSIVIGCFDNRIIMFLCELFQGIYVGKLLFTHSFKIYVKLSVLQHKVDAVHTIGTNTYKIIISISCLHVSQYIRQFVYRNPGSNRDIGVYTVVLRHSFIPMPAKTAFKHTIEKKEDRTLRSFALIYIFVIERRYTAENVYNYMLSI